MSYQRFKKEIQNEYGTSFGRLSEVFFRKAIEFSEKENFEDAVKTA